MSESENIALVQSLYSAFGRGDVAYIVSKLAGDVSWEYEAPEVISYAGIRRGPAEAAGFFLGIAESETDQVLAMTEFIASGDKVATFGRYQTTVRSTGRRIDTPVAHLFEIRDGKVTRYVNLVNSALMVEARTPAAATA